MSVIRPHPTKHKWGLWARPGLWAKPVSGQSEVCGQSRQSLQSLSKQVRQSGRVHDPGTRRQGSHVKSIDQVARVQGADLLDPAVRLGQPSDQSARVDPTLAEGGQLDRPIALGEAFPVGPD